MTDFENLKENFAKNKAEPIGDWIFKADISPELFEEKEFSATEYICQSLSPHSFSIIGRAKSGTKFLSIVLPLNSPKTKTEYEIGKGHPDGARASLTLTSEIKSAISGKVSVKQTEDIVDADFAFIVKNEGKEHNVKGRVHVKPTAIS